MRKTYTQNIGEIINDCLKDLKIDKKIKEVHVIKSWDEFVGKTIAKATREITIHDKKLFLKIESSIIRNELMLIKDPLIKRINEYANEEIITNIIFR